MSYYWFNRKWFLQKCRNCGGKEKAAKYCIYNKEVLKEKTNNRYRKLSEKEKENMEEIDTKTSDMRKEKKKKVNKLKK